MFIKYKKDLSQFEEDFDVESFSKKIVFFEDFPVVDDIVLAYRGISWVLPYINYLQGCYSFSDFLDNNNIPGIDSFLSRISKKTNDPEIKEMSIALRDLSYFWDDYEKIKTKNKFFVEGALGSIQTKLDILSPQLIHLFKKEVIRLDWNLKEDTEEELQKKFPVLLYPYRNNKGDYAKVFKNNLKCLKELIDLL